MSDSNVLATQRYLNAMFGGSEHWVALEENGNTGTKTMQGIIRAFQIHNNVPNPTGNLGPNTINKMKSLANISKMNASDPSNINVCLIQCALFCKGYAAGGITGIYYTNGVNAVKAMQADSGLPVTGIIDWKVWAGLLSLNWFILAQSGDPKLRKIQQQLNADYSDIIGVGPCDGIKSRVTALSLLGALQAAEGVTTAEISMLSKTSASVIWATLSFLNSSYIRFTTWLSFKPPCPIVAKQSSQLRNPYLRCTFS